MLPDTFLLHETQFGEFDTSERWEQSFLDTGWVLLPRRPGKAVQYQSSVDGHSHGVTISKGRLKKKIRKEKQCQEFTSIFIFKLSLDAIVLSQDAPCRVSEGGRSTSTYKSILCSAEVEPGGSFIAEIPRASSHFPGLMVDTSGY